jgi:threonine dehydrogenase-like Zn-dependent dehydrogenase
MPAFNFKEIEILETRVYERKDFEAAIDLAMRVPLERIVTHAYSLQDVGAAFGQFRTGDVCKVLILPPENTR